MALQIAEAVCLMHGVRGGPFLHTDLKPDQFLLDDAGNVFLNDLNRGKFAPFRFELDDNRVFKCWLCDGRVCSRWKAPEETRAPLLDEKCSP